MHCSLIKPPKEQMRHYNWCEWVGEFERGERIILVDGVRWGRTHCTWHGCWGTRITIRQDNGGCIADENGPIEIRSGRKGRWDEESTDNKVLKKVQELVAAGKLRDPKIVQAENEKAAAEYSRRAAERDAQEELQFRKRACEALGLNSDNGSELVTRVVAAMRWAQSK